ncbi:MAG: hypothetical protein ACI87J_002590 [Colwellia sp.]|jgi:hypothetical protein
MPPCSLAEAGEQLMVMKWTLVVKDVFTAFLNLSPTGPPKSKRFHPA